MRARDERAVAFVATGQITKYMETDPVHFYKNYARIKPYFGFQLHFTRDRREFQNFWIYGPPGTFKSVVVNALYPHAYTLRDKYWDGFSPFNPHHRVVVLKDVNSRWILDYGITQIKVLADKDGHNIDVKYAGGEVVNHSRVIITSNFTIDECLQGTSRDEIVGLATEIQAVRRRYQEIHIDDFLLLCGLTPRPREQIAYLYGQQIDDYRVFFHPVDEILLPGYGQELSAVEVPNLTSLIEKTGVCDD